MADISSEVTAFLVTTGEITTDAAMAALRGQSAAVSIDVVQNLAPMSKAFQAMVDRCKTRYYIQVDADMLLHPFAAQRLYEVISTSPVEVAMVCAPLWDAFERRAVQGVKIHRTSTYRQFPYRDVYACEIDQNKRLTDGGYKIHSTPIGGRDTCYGLHGTYHTIASAYKRWNRLVVKQRRSIVTDPPHGLLSWTNEYFTRHVQWYNESPDPVRLAAIMGMIVGLTDIPADHEDNYQLADPVWERLRDHYFVEPK